MHVPCMANVDAKILDVVSKTITIEGGIKIKKRLHDMIVTIFDTQKLSLAHIDREAGKTIDSNEDTLQDIPNRDQVVSRDRQVITHAKKCTIVRREREAEIQRKIGS